MRIHFFFIFATSLTQLILKCGPKVMWWNLIFFEIFLARRGFRLISWGIYRPFFTLKYFKTFCLKSKYLNRVQQIIHNTYIRSTTRTKQRIFFFWKWHRYRQNTLFKTMLFQENSSPAAPKLSAMGRGLTKS